VTELAVTSSYQRQAFGRDLLTNNCDWSDQLRRRSQGDWVWSVTKLWAEPFPTTYRRKRRN